MWRKTFTATKRKMMARHAARQQTVVNHTECPNGQVAKRKQQKRQLQLLPPTNQANARTPLLLPTISSSRFCLLVPLGARANALSLPFSNFHLPASKQPNQQTNQLKIGASKALWVTGVLVEPMCVYSTATIVLHCAATATEWQCNRCAYNNFDMHTITLLLPQQQHYQRPLSVSLIAGSFNHSCCPEWLASCCHHWSVATSLHAFTIITFSI